jgi:sulfide:quinone oxidoreductase
MSSHQCDIAIVGAGAAGIAVAASLKKRQAQLSITLIDPAEKHYYQPGWTMVGRGVFTPQSTERDTASLIPKGVKWLTQAVASFDPMSNTLTLDNDESVQYEQLVVAAGLSLNWTAVEGLAENLGKNGVTSNYT